jgi:hypothetical protein
MDFLLIAILWKLHKPWGMLIQIAMALKVKNSSKKFSFFIRFHFRTFEFPYFEDSIYLDEAKFSKNCFH